MVVCVFGASSAEIDEIYISKTYDLGVALAKRGHTLMFGGGGNGLMGAAARGFSGVGQHITGVAPSFFNVDGVLYEKCDKMVYTDTMRDRKKYMEDNSDAFVVVPGGIGTYEEFFEVLTLKQLAQLSAPIVLFNINGFYDKLVKLMDEDNENGFIRKGVKDLFVVTDSIEEVIKHIENADTGTREIIF